MTITHVDSLAGVAGGPPTPTRDGQRASLAFVENFAISGTRVLQVKFWSDVELLLCRWDEDGGAVQEPVHEAGRAMPPDNM